MKSTPPPGAATLNCIDPALLYCELCRGYVIAYSGAVLLVVAYLFLLDSELLQEKLGSVRFLASVVDLVGLPATDVKVFETQPKAMSPPQPAPFEDELTSVRNRVMNMA